MKSWKTTLAAGIAACGVGFKQSNEPVLQTIGAVLEPIGLVLIGLFARDNNVTSESAGAK